MSFKGSHYQHLSFGSVQRPGRDVSPEYDALFPDGIGTDTLLDMGCNIGYFVIRAAWEGAGQAVGVERNGEYAAVGQEAIAQLELSAAYIVQQDIFKYDSGKTANGEPWLFDHVLCLNVLHHMKSPEKAAELAKKCVSLARKRAAFVITPPGETEPLDGFDGRWRWETTPAGSVKLRLSPQFIGDLFPEFEMRVRQSAAKRKRIAVEILVGSAHPHKTISTDSI
jgi:cyclopropane fatty-acyl-phospholipid synthase-like methyltransferase